MRQQVLTFFFESTETLKGATLPFSAIKDTHSSSSQTTSASAGSDAFL